MSHQLDVESVVILVGSLKIQYSSTLSILIPKGFDRDQR